MVTMSWTKRLVGAAAVLLAVVGLGVATPAAEAGVRVAVGVGFGVPVFAPPIVVAPVFAPPVVVAPPVVYAAPAVVAAPVFVTGGFFTFDRFGHRHFHRR